MEKRLRAVIGMFVLLMSMTGCGRTEQKQESITEAFSFGSAVLNLLEEKNKENADQGWNTAAEIPENDVEESAAGECDSYEENAGSQEYVAAPENGVQIGSSDQENVSEESVVSEEEEFVAEGILPEAKEDPYWPDNEYTRMLPKPDIGIAEAAMDDFGFSVHFTENTTIQDIVAYAAIAQEQGFNVNAEADARASGDIPHYSFIADNTAGYSIELYWLAGGSGMALRKKGT